MAKDFRRVCMRGTKLLDARLLGSKPDVAASNGNGPPTFAMVQTVSSCLLALPQSYSGYAKVNLTNMSLL